MIYGVMERPLIWGRALPRTKNQSDSWEIDFAEIQRNVFGNQQLGRYKVLDVHGDGDLNLDEIKHTRTNITYRRIKHADQTESDGIVPAE